MLVMIMAMMTMPMTTSHSSSLTLHSSPFQPSSQWHLPVVDQLKKNNKQQTNKQTPASGHVNQFRSIQSVFGDLVE